VAGDRSRVFGGGHTQSDFPGLFFLLGMVIFEVWELSFV